MKRYVIIIGLVVLAAAAAIATVAFASGSGPGAKRASSIAWEPCHGAAEAAPKVQCGSIQVPLDWAKPGGAKITVRFARRRADSPDRRVGTLFFHPGGPGDGGIGYLTSQSADVNAVFSPTLRARFDIIGVDPRGFGESTPVSCGVPVTVAGVTLFPRTSRQFRRLVQHNRALAMSCLRDTGPLLGHVDAESVARDHEAVRAALGVREVNFLGISYGTQVAAIYAELYPTRVRTITLDAALEHSVSDSLMLAAEASAVEDSFNRFALWCRTAAACALKSRDVGRLYDDLVKRADRAPIPVAGAVRPVNGEDIRLRTQLFLLFKEPSIYGPFASWAALSQLIKAARAGDASAFATFPTDSQHRQRLLGAGGRVRGIPLVGPHLRRDAAADPARQAARTPPTGRVANLDGRALHRLAARGSQPAPAPRRPGHAADPDRQRHPRPVDHIRLGTRARRADPG